MERHDRRATLIKIGTLLAKLDKAILSGDYSGAPAILEEVRNLLSEQALTGPSARTRS